MPTSLYIYFEILSVLCAVIYYRELHNFHLGIWLPLVLINCITDIIGDNFAKAKIPNYYIYNSYLLISTPLYLCAFFKMLNYKGFIKKIFVVISILILLFIMLNLVFIQGHKEFDTYSLILIEFIISLLSLLVLLKLFNDNSSHFLLQDHPHFWIGGATLIFSVSTLFILGLQKFIEVNQLQIDGKNIYRILIPLLNIILYSSYSYAFFLCKKLTSRSLQQ
jgi:hypothetical protein